MGGRTENQPVLKLSLAGDFRASLTNQEGNMISPKQSNREVATVALRLQRRSSVYIVTSYPPPAVSSTPGDEFELPLPTGPCAVWLSDSTVISSEVDAGDWPAWTDEVRFASGEGVAR
jgi:hypothetical protein